MSGRSQVMNEKENVFTTIRVRVIRIEGERKVHLLSPKYDVGCFSSTPECIFISVHFNMMTLCTHYSMFCY